MASSSRSADNCPATAPARRRQWLCARLWQRQGCLLADEMGLGKTATCLASLAVLMGIEGSSARPTTKSFLSVVCCPAGVQRTWASEASKWLRPTPRLLLVLKQEGRGICRFSSVDVHEARAFARQKRLQERVDARSRKKWTGQESYTDSMDDDAYRALREVRPRGEAAAYNIVRSLSGPR